MPSQDQLRERFVRHHGKAKLAVSLLELEVPAVVDGFLTALAGEVNPGLIKALSSRFSTTSDDEHTAHGIAVMDSMSPFFDYEVRCVCGIPSVTLLGTPDDWRSLRARFAVLAEYDLQGWAKLLTPVLDQLVRSSEGEVDREFWQSIYKPKSAYGADLATGWLVRLSPYSTDLSGHVQPLEVTPRKEVGTRAHRDERAAEWAQLRDAAAGVSNRRASAGDAVQRLLWREPAR